MSKQPTLIERFVHSYLQAANKCFGTVGKSTVALVFVALFGILVTITMNLMIEVAYIVYPHTILIQQIFYIASILIFIILFSEVLNIVVGNVVLYIVSNKIKVIKCP